MMEKFIQISKKVLFWTAYTLLVVMNLFVILNLIPEIYFSFTDVEHWRRYYSPIGNQDSDYTPNIYMHIWGIFILCGTITSSVLGSYLIFKNKKIKGFLVLSFLVYILILNAFCGEYILEIIWEGSNFP